MSYVETENGRKYVSNMSFEERMEHVYGFEPKTYSPGLRGFFSRKIDEYCAAPCQGLGRLAFTVAAGAAIASASPWAAAAVGVAGVFAGSFGGMMSLFDPLEAKDEGQIRTEMLQKYRDGASPDEIFGDVDRPRTAGEKAAHFFRHPISSIYNAAKSLPNNNIGLLLGGSALVAISGIGYEEVAVSAWETINVSGYTTALAGVLVGIFGSGAALSYLDREKKNKAAMEHLEACIREDFAKRESGELPKDGFRAPELGWSCSQMLPGEPITAGIDEVVDEDMRRHEQSRQTRRFGP